MPKPLPIKLNKQILEQALQTNGSLGKAAKALGISRTTVTRYAGLYGLDTSYLAKKITKLDLLGRRFGKLVVMAEICERSSDGRVCWRCRCDCGREKDVVGHSLMSGITSSCGCLLLGLEPQLAAAIVVWRRDYNDGNLTINEFLSISKMDCHYCGVAPSNVVNPFKNNEYVSSRRRESNGYAYNGLDRVDNSRPHDRDNVVPCCHHCNFAKSDLTLDQFRAHLLRMLSYRLAVYGGDFTLITLPKLTHRFDALLQPREKTAMVLRIEPGDVFGKLTVLEEVDRGFCNDRLFLCRCECGVKKPIRMFNLLYGKTRTCGNMGCRNRYSPIASSARAIWRSVYKDENGDLPFEAFFELSQMRCSYCGEEPSNSYNGFVYNGLDRIDPSKRHTLDNVVPCCYPCNWMKSDCPLQGFDDWLIAIDTHFLVVG